MAIPSQSMFGMATALNILSKTTTGLKWLIAGYESWEKGYTAIKTIIQGPNMSNVNVETISPEEEIFLRDGNKNIKVYGYDRHDVDTIGGFSCYNAIFINHWLPRIKKTLPEALQNPNDPDLCMWAGLRDHELGHINNGDFIITPIVYVNMPITTGLTQHYIANKIFPKNNLKQSTVARQIIRSCSKLPVGIGLALINQGINIAYRRWIEYRADDRVKQENIDGMIRFLSETDKALTEYAPTYLAETGKPLWMITFGHPSFANRIARLEKRKKAYEDMHKTSHTEL